MTIFINGTTGISGVDGSAGTPALQGTDTNTGISFGSDVIIGSTGGVERFRVDSQGRLAIGSTSPSHRLTVTQTAGGVMANFTNGADADFNIGCTSGVTTIGPEFGVLALKSVNTERARIDSSGRLLVGTSTAANNLGTGAIQVGSGHTGIVNTGSVAPPTILSSGSLEFSLDGVSGTQRHGRISGNGSTTGGAYAGGLTFEYYAYDGSTYRWFPGITLDSGGNVAFAGDNITTSNGNIGRVYKFFGAANNIIFVGETTGSDRYTILEHRRNGRSGSARCSQISIGENASTQGSIDIYASAANADLSGGVRLANGATSWSSISDIRLKDITSLFDNALSDVSALQAFRFTWKDDASATPQVGLSAQSVQAVLPEAVSSGKPINASEDDDTEYLSVRYTEVIPLLVAALQESKQRIETLETRLNALEVTQ